MMGWLSDGQSLIHDGCLFCAECVFIPVRRDGCPTVGRDFDWKRGSGCRTSVGWFCQNAQSHMTVRKRGVTVRA